MVECRELFFSLVPPEYCRLPDERTERHTPNFGFGRKDIHQISASDGKTDTKFRLLTERHTPNFGFGQKDIHQISASDG